MDKQKGFATLAIIGIVLGILVVGGGAYYLGMNKTQDKKVEENLEVDNQEENNDSTKGLSSEVKVEVNKEASVKENKEDEGDKVEEKEDKEDKTSEESTVEVFKNQPGAIKYMVSMGNNKWILSVDLLTNNSDWIPGVNNPYINQNKQIRNLYVDSNTKVYGCGMSSSGALVNVPSETSKFMFDLNKTIDQRKLDIDYRVGGPVQIMTDWATLNFNIVDTNITAIYEQCLP